MVMALKLSLDERRHDGVQGLRLDRRVGEHEGEHGRHIRRDHAGAFGDAVDRDLDAIDMAAARGELRKGIGGHDRPRRHLVSVGLGLVGEIAQEPDELSGIERLTDHAGRGDVDVRIQTVRDLSRCVHRLLHRLAAAHAGKGIGIAGIDHQRPGHAVPQMLPAPFDRRRSGLRLGQHAGNGRAGIEQRQKEVRAPRIADACRAGRQAHPVNGG